MSKKSIPEPELESPIPFQSGSNGEYVPAAPNATVRRAEALFRETVDDRCRKLGLSRRQFLESSAGMATALWVINQTAGCGDSAADAIDGGYAVDAAMTYDGAQACEALAGSEFIFDVQTHHVNPMGAWRQSNPGWEFFLQGLPQGSCVAETDAIECFNVQNYVREMFVNSETAVAVLTAVPADPGENPLEAADAKATRDIVNSLAQSQRLVTHGLVLPDLGQAQLDAMQSLKEDLTIAAWKVYTPFGGWRLDDPVVGIPFIERARALGVKIICAHKGLPLFGFDPAFASPDDIGVVAAMYPDVKFVVYHSGYETDVAEGAYDPAGLGIDRLIKSCLDHGIGPSGNVYAELGSTWKNLMTKPTEAQHAIGKLLKYLGPDRIVWGTDSIWYGTPQDQITAFRALTISDQLQLQEGYPALTSASRARIFGLNAAELYGIDVGAVRCAIAEDDITQLKRAAGEAPKHAGRGHWRAYGPQTRREFFDFLRSRDGKPG